MQLASADTAAMEPKSVSVKISTAILRDTPKPQTLASAPSLAALWNFLCACHPALKHSPLQKNVRTFSFLYVGHSLLRSHTPLHPTL